MSNTADEKRRREVELNPENATAPLLAPPGSTGTPPRSWSDYLVEVAIYIFMGMSFYTTARGIRIFIPDEVGAVAGIRGSTIVAVVASLAVQTLLLAMAFRVRRYGARPTFLILYCLCAAISIAFSYFGLYQIYSGSFLNRRADEDFRSKAEVYRSQVQSTLVSADGIVEGALAVVAQMRQHEEATGGAMLLEDTASPYFNRLRRQSGQDFSQRAVMPGKGPIFTWLASTVKLLERQKTSLAESLKRVDGMSSERAIRDSDTADAVRTVRQVASSVDWALVESVMRAADQQYEKPTVPVLARVGAQAADSSQAAQIQWAVDALKAIPTDWSSAVVGPPLAIAILLDLVVLIVAFFFPDPRREREAHSRTQQEVDMVIRALLLKPAELAEGIHAVVYNLEPANRRGSRWRIGLPLVEAMSLQGRLVLIQLQRAGLATQGRLRSVYFVSSLVRSALYARLRLRPVRAA